MLGEEPPDPTGPCHSHPPESPLKALPMFHASPESRPPTEKWSSSEAGVIYIHSQARGSEDPWGEWEEGGRLGGQGCWPGCDHRHGTRRGRLRGDCRTLFGPVVKRGSPWWSPKPILVPVTRGGWELWTTVMAG